jgi:glycosyltransferase involved in cell wall biosynthesis
MNRISQDIAYRSSVEAELGFEGLFDGYKMAIGQDHVIRPDKIVTIEDEIFSEVEPSLENKLRNDYYLEKADRKAGRNSVSKTLNAIVQKLSDLQSFSGKRQHPPVISIVTPSYNQDEFIGETISSVIQQAGDFYIDYIIVDGLSDDNTYKISRRYQALCNTGDSLEQRGQKFYKNANILCLGISFRFISEKDSGQANAINKGFRMAVGDIFGWLNSDDFYYSEKALSHVADAFARSSAHFLYGRGVRVDRSGFYVREEAYVNNFKPEKIRLVDFILQPSAFWKRDVFEKTGLINEKYHYVFDWDYWIRISDQFALRKLNTILSCYRVYGETKTFTGGERRELEIIDLLRSHGSYNNVSIHLNNLEGRA